MPHRRDRYDDDDDSREVEPASRAGVNPVVWGGLTLAGAAVVAVGMLLVVPAVRKVQEAARRAEEQNAARRAEPVVAPAAAQQPAEPAVIDVQLADLIAPYQTNEVAADRANKGQWLRVTGVVDRIAKDPGGNAFVDLSRGEMFAANTVTCYTLPDEVSAVSRLVPGRTVTVVGRCDGKVLDVLLKDCRIAR